MNFVKKKKIGFLAHEYSGHGKSLENSKMAQSQVGLKIQKK